MVEILVNDYMHQDTSNGSLKLIFQTHTSKSQTKLDSMKGFICTVATYIHLHMDTLDFKRFGFGPC